MANKNQRRNGQVPLAYQGVPAIQPTDFVTNSRDPLSTDSKNVFLGTWWLNTVTNGLWYLSNITGNVATWTNVQVATGLNTLTGDTGGAVSPDVSHNINLLSGSSLVAISGNPGTHTLTVTGSSALANQFATDSGTAIPVSSILNVNGGLNINTSGTGNTVTVKTPTLAEGIVYANSSGVFTSLSKGTNGQVLIASTAGVPSWQNITSTGASVTITNGAHTINLETASPPATTTVGFSAYKSTVSTNAVGDANKYFYLCDTKLFDIGTNYDNTTGIFTAPSTGYYLFYANCFVSFTGTIGYFQIGFAVSTGAVYVVYRNYGNFSQLQAAGCGWASFMLTSGQTVKPWVTLIMGSAGKTGSVGNLSTRNTMFSGYKL